MRGLSLHQHPLPYASLVAYELKVNETRSLMLKEDGTISGNFLTSYRGDVAIHAAKAKKSTSVMSLQKLIKPGSPHYYEYSQLKSFIENDTLPYGCIVAVAQLTDCIIMTPEVIASQTPLEIAVGLWQPGRVALKLENVWRLKNPIPIERGWQSWGKTTPEQDELIYSQLNETESEDVSVSDTPEIQPFKVIKKPYGTEYWTHIQAWQARNWDGSSAGYKQGTPDGERTCTEKKFVPNDKQAPTRYTNYW